MCQALSAEKQCPGTGDSKCIGSRCVQETQRLMCWEVANKGKFRPCDGGQSTLFIFFKDHCGYSVENESLEGKTRCREAHPMGPPCCSGKK